MIDKPAYRLFDRNGAEVRYGAMLDHLAASAAVLFGELHIDPIVHWLQFEVAKDLFARVRERLIVGAEMFEADDQIIIDDFIVRFRRIWSKQHPAEGVKCEDCIDVGLIGNKTYD